MQLKFSCKSGGQTACQKRTAEPSIVIDPSSFVAVTGIIGVPTTAKANETLTLSEKIFLNLKITKFISDWLLWLSTPSWSKNVKNWVLPL